MSSDLDVICQTVQLLTSDALAKARPEQSTELHQGIDSDPPQCEIVNRITLQFVSIQLSIVVRTGSWSPDSIKLEGIGI